MRPRISLKKKKLDIEPAAIPEKPRRAISLKKIRLVPKKTALTHEQMMERHTALLQELNSSATETVTYGDHDPFSVPVSLCDTCGGKGILKKLDGEEIKWGMGCDGCDKTIQTPQRRPWQAALLWCEVNAGTQSYKELPLFELRGLDFRKAMTRMLGIKHNITLRKKIAGYEKCLGSKTSSGAPDPMYHQSLDAYLKWATLAIRLIKAERDKCGT